MLDGIYEHSPWVADGRGPRRPVPDARRAEARACRGGPRSAARRAARAAPRAPGARRQGALAGDADGGVDRRAGARRPRRTARPTSSRELRRLNDAYVERFGWPFIARGARSARRRALARRDHRDLRAPARRASRRRVRRVRCADRTASPSCASTSASRRGPKRGEAGLGSRRGRSRSTAIPGFAENGQLTVTYLTDAHRACARTIERWMRDARLRRRRRSTRSATSSASIAARRPDAKRLLTGSHYDTVRNGGRYDGRLGILVPMAVRRATCIAPAGACRSRSRSSRSPRRKASATRRPSSARARSPATSTRAGSTRPTPTA